MPFRKVKAIVEAIGRDLAAGIPESGIMPSVSDLARRFATSRLTMRRALRALAEQGRLVCRDDIGVCCVAGRTLALDSLSVEPEFEKLAHRIRADILQYRRRPSDSQIPSRKDLAARFGCSPATVRRALNHLLATGIIERRGRSFVQPAVTLTRGSSAVVHVCGNPSVLDQASLVRECVREIERTVYELGWSGIRLLLSRTPASLPAPPRNEVAGYIVLSRTKGWWSFLSRQAQIPSVYVDTVGGTYWSRGAPGPRALHIEADNVAAGSRLARHLAALGHEGVAFINPIAGEYVWDHGRIDGIRQHFSPTGPHEALGRMLALSSGAGPSREARFDTRDLSALSAATLSAARKVAFLTPELVGEKLDGLAGIRDIQNVAARGWPLFDQAFADRGITAWVCANDLVAALAAAYLRSQGAARARRISLASFDNSDLAYRLNLTSWDFAITRIGRMAAQWLAHPEARRRTAPVATRVEGTLVVRESTRRR